MSLQTDSKSTILESQHSLNFLCIYWNKEAEFINKESSDIRDIHYVIFDLIRQGENSLALKRLDSMNQDIMNDSNKGFHYYLKGLISKDKEDYYKSIKILMSLVISSPETAPILELEKLGENRILLEILST